jgi:hypothetical protein
MKRQILTIAAVLALVFAGAVFAQGENTSVPGPTIQQKPGLTNNNLPNPGNPVNLNTTGQQPTPLPETESTDKPVDVDVDTGANAEGAVDVDVSTTPDADTEASGVNTGTETGVADTSGTDETTDTMAGDTDTLPATAGELPTVALIGLLAFGAFFVVRARRNA